MGKLKGHKRFFIFLAVCVVAICTYTAWLPLPARFLTVKDNIKRVDCIIVLSGDRNFCREIKAVELYKKGFAGKIIRILEVNNIALDEVAELLNLNIEQRDIYSRYFQSKGVPKEAIILGEMVAKNTFNELEAAKEIVLKNHFNSIMLVTSNYHMRRTLMTAKWVFRSCGIKIYNASAYYKDFSPDRWWLHEKDTKDVVMEHLSILFYLIYHFMLGKG